MSQGASRWQIQRLRKAQLNEPSNGEDTTAERNNAFSGINDVDDIDDSLPGAYAITNVMHGESEISIWDTNDIDTSTINQVFPPETSTNLNENDSLEQEHRYLLIFLLSQSIQIYCYVVFLAIAVAIIVIGFNSSLISPAPNPTPSSTPSTITQSESPTSYQWNFHSEIVSDKVSFGYDVKLSADGNILVVSSPYHENGKGRFVLILESCRGKKLQEVGAEPKEV